MAIAFYLFSYEQQKLLIMDRWMDIQMNTSKYMYIYMCIEPLLKSAGA